MTWSRMNKRDELFKQVWNIFTRKKQMLKAGDAVWQNR